MTCSSNNIRLGQGAYIAVVTCILNSILALGFVPVCDNGATEVDHSGAPGGGRVLEGALQVIHSLVCKVDVNVK